MRLNSDIQIPANVTATVKSVSAVGEQYVDLVPPPIPSPTTLRNGAVIGRSAPRFGQDIAGLLREADRLVSSVGDTRLAGPAARNVQGVQRIRARTGAADPVGAAAGRRGQRQLRPQTSAADRPGRSVPGRADPQRRRHQVAGRRTGAVHQRSRKGADPQLRSLLQTVPGRGRGGQRHLRGIRPSFPVLAANLANFGRIGVIYSKSIEQALVIFPALMAALLTVGGELPADEGGKLDFKISINDPPPCIDGIPAAAGDSLARRHDTARSADRPVLQNGAERSDGGAWREKLPVPGIPRQACADDPAVPRPARLRPDRQQSVAWTAGADRHADGCPGGRHTEDGRNILPPNKFPYIPPQNDPDPGYPVAPGLVPPGVQPGPGPAPHQPWPYIPPPNDGPPPPPLTAWIPPAPYPDAWPPPAVPPGWATNPPPDVFAGPYGPPHRRRPRHPRPHLWHRTSHRPAGPHTERMTSTPVSSLTPPAVPGSTRLVLPTCGLRRTGWT